MAYKSRKCKYCGKIIEGLSQNQADYNLKLHEESCKKKNVKNK